MKRIIVTLLVLLGLAAAGLLLFVQFYSPEAQRAQLERKLSEAFGAPAHIGSLKLSLTGGLGVEARDVRVELDPAYGPGSLLEIEEVLANVSVWHFLTTRELGIRSVSVTRPRIQFVKNPDGRWNWSTIGSAAVSRRDLNLPVLASVSPAVAAAGAATSNQLERISIADATLTMVDATVEPATRTEYKGLAMDADVTAGQGERRLSGRIRGNSEAAGGEPLDIDLPFDLRMTRVGESNRWSANGTVAGAAIATRNARLEGIVATVSLDEAQRLVIPQLRMRLYDGEVDATASIDLGTATNRFTMQGKIAQLDLSRALAPRPEISSTLRGVATATFQINGELGGYAETLASLEGDGIADVADARLESVNLVAEIAKKANLTLVEFSETDTAASSLRTAFRFERGTLRLIDANATRISGCVNLKVSDGIIGLGDRPTVAIAGSITILPEIQERVRADAPATRLLLAALTRGTGVTVPLKVRGPLASPAVDLDWASVARSIFFGAGNR